jgi:TRAP-type mannitol/chloroaromatic compound transport system substrate-binding protein
MKRSSMWMIGVVIITTLVFAAYTIDAAAQEKPIKWRTQSTFGVGSWDFVHGERAIERIGAMSQGRLQLGPLLAPGTIVPAYEVLDAVNRGILEAGQGWSGYWVGKNSAFTLFSSATGGPFGMDAWDWAAWLLFGGGYDLWKELFESTGYTNVVPFMIKGELPEPLGWFPKPITSFEDLKGLKMRVAGMAADVFKEAGVAVVNVSGGEILPLLERKTIDATEYSDPHSDLLLGLPDILKFYEMPGIHQPSGCTELLINKKKWEQLSQDLKDIVEVVCNEMTLKNNFEEWIYGQEALEKIEKEYGVQVVRTPDEVLIKFLEAWDKVAARECEANPMFKKIYESQKEWASKYVPYRRKFYIDYSKVADYYWKK